MNKLSVIAVSFFAFGALTVSAQAACTTQEAISKLTTITDGMSANKIPTDKIATTSQELNNAGGLLAKGDYNGACAIYDKLIGEFKLSTK